MRLDSAALAPEAATTIMEILYVLIPVSVLLVLAILAVLGWSVHSGQFEDIEQEGLRILQDEQKDKPKVKAHQK